MLILGRKEGEKIVIGDNIVLTVVRISGGKVRVGIEAPQGTSIRRDELPKLTTLETRPFREREPELAMS